MQAAQLGGDMVGGENGGQGGEAKERESQNQCQSQRNERLRIENLGPFLNQGLAPARLRSEWTDS